uniref:Peptidase A2 domain-containing protein n=1 Tax=Sphaeramia orbicularis TaxID=375764 RepID=A0A672Z0G2_9TELE
LTVNGVNLPFLVDSGATYSVIKHADLTPTPQLSGKTIVSMLAGGKLDRESFTVPLTCVSQECSFQHSFLLSPIYPINLCGRDLMCKLGVKLESGPEGLMITQGNTVTTYTIQPGAHVSPPDDLYCASHFSPGGPDSTYEEKPCQKQYPLKQEAIDGITPVFEAYLNAGIIVPCPDSPVRTPIFPLKKARTPPVPDTWRFIQDLQAVNSRGATCAHGSKSTHNFVTNSAPILVHVAFRNKMYTWTCIPQGYCEAPTIYNSILADSLSHLDLPPGVAPLQYVDDLLLYSPAVAKALVTDILFCFHWGIPKKISSDNGSRFVNTALTELGNMLGFDLKTHCVYHPQSGGAG